LNHLPTSDALEGSSASPYHSSFKGLVSRTRRSFDDRKTIGSLAAPVSRKALPLARYLSRFFIRGSFFSLLQLAEAFFLMRYHFFFIPPSSVGVLAVLSVAHTGALAIALSFRRVAAHARAVPALAHVDRRAVTTLMISAVVISFSLLSLALLGVITLATNVHFSSPPIYRAMLTGWIIALPLEVGIILGLYTARQRGIALFGDRLTVYLGLEAICGCLSVMANLPLVYLATRLTFLFFSWRLVYPIKSRTTAPPHERRERRLLLSRALPQLCRIGLASACLELAPKLAYLPIVHRDPSFALTLVVAQRLIQLSSASALRVADLLHREFRRWIAFGSQRLRSLAYTRAFSTLCVASILTLLLSPIMAARYAATSWSSPYNEHLEPASLTIALFVLLLALRPATLGMARLVEDTPAPGAPNSKPCLILGTFAMVVSATLNVSLWAGYSPELPITQLAEMLLTVELVALIAALVWLRSKVVKGALWRWEDLGILSLRKGHEGGLSVRVAQIKAPMELRHLLYRSTFDLARLPLIDISPSALIAPNDPKVWEVFKDPAGGIELSGHTLREILEIILHSTKSTSAKDLLIKADRERFIELLSSVQTHGGSSPPSPAESEIEVVPIDHALLCNEPESDERRMRYLDLLTERGSLTTPARLKKSVRGVLHLNNGVSPSHLVLVGTKSRMYFSEFGYVALHYNLFQAGFESSPWPGANESATRSTSDPHTTLPL